MIIAVSKHFPPDTRICFPKGGLCIWVELNPKIDAMKVYQKAYEKKISLLPGNICSSSDTYNNCLRINCGSKWNPRIENGIKTLADIIEKMISNP